MPQEMQKQYIWRYPSDDAVPPINSIADLPLTPQVRSEFWKVEQGQRR